MPKLLAGVRNPITPPERYVAQEVLHLAAFADWESVLALDQPPNTADFPAAAHHFARRCENASSVTINMHVHRYFQVRKGGTLRVLLT